MQVLSDFLLLSYDPEEETGSPARSPNDFGSPERKSFILRHTTYHKANKNNAIKLLLRSKKLYQAIHDIKKLLEIMLI